MERRLAERANIILLAAAATWKISTSRRGWRLAAIQSPGGENGSSNWASAGLSATRRGPVARMIAENGDEIVRKTTLQNLSTATHLSTRSMARAAGVSEASVRRVWHANGLKPHRVEMFRQSATILSLSRNWRMCSVCI